MGHGLSLWKWDAAMILRCPRRVKERFGGFLRYGRDFVHMNIDNLLKSIILKLLKNYRNTVDKGK
jgi:hypothetical protein